MPIQKVSFYCGEGRVLVFQSCHQPVNLRPSPGAWDLRSGASMYLSDAVSGHAVSPLHASFRRFHPILMSVGFEMFRIIFEKLSTNLEKGT